ncbi:MAG: hypothetical protein SV186_06655 [Candidatus Nanohaloarchaea archaeon]|nr:hypothetical protein [Candidatus Nanohaloarchaea archaeon]
MHYVLRALMGVLGLVLTYYLVRLVLGLRAVKHDPQRGLKFTPGTLYDDLAYIGVGSLLFIAGFVVFTAATYTGNYGLREMGEIVIFSFFLPVTALFRRWNLRLHRSITS